MRAKVEIERLQKVPDNRTGGVLQYVNMWNIVGLTPCFYT